MNVVIFDICTIVLIFVFVLLIFLQKPVKIHAILSCIFWIFSGAGPLRSSLKKPKQKDLASVSSKTSSKRVQISIGSEQTAI